MGTFFNNLKRAFTAPKTRDMQKKINSMKDYMGFTKKLFEQMEQDAIFFKTCEEIFGRAIYGLTEPTDPAWTHRRLTKTAKNRNIFNDLHAHNINWYKIGDNELSEFETNTNNDIRDMQVTYTDPKRLNNLQDLMITINPNNKNSEKTYTISRNTLDQYIKILKTYRDFCRKTKQRIKTLFEKKQKEFETLRKNEKASLQLLQKHQQNLKIHLNNNNFREALQTWDTIHTTYAQLNTKENAENNKLTHITYQIAKQAIQNYIKTSIKTLCNNINTQLTSYAKDKKYENKNQLKSDDAATLQNSTDEFNQLINACLTAEADTLESICIPPNELTKILGNITTATYKFLDPNNTTPIDEIKFSSSIKTVNNILKTWPPV